MRLKVLWKFYRTQYGELALLTLLSGIAYWWGWYVSKVDGMAFSRSGAIATAFLAFFIVSDYPERLGKVQQAVTDAIDKSGNWTDASRAIRSGAKDRAKAHLDLTRTVIQYWYAILLFIATMIWGLGDLIYVLEHDESVTAGELIMKLMYLGAR